MSQTHPRKRPDSAKRNTPDPARWLDLYGDDLFRFAWLRVRNDADAEELVQATLLKGFQAFGNFRGEASVKTWLIQILRNEIATLFRQRARSKVVQPTPAPGGSSAMSELLHVAIEPGEFSAAVERDEFWQVVQDCFDQIPEHLLEVFLLRLANEDEKIDSLCKQLDLKPSNFSVRLFRTRLMLRKCLEKKWL